MIMENCSLAFQLRIDLRRCLPYSQARQHCRSRSGGDIHSLMLRLGSHIVVHQVESSWYSMRCSTRRCGFRERASVASVFRTMFLMHLSGPRRNTGEKWLSLHNRKLKAESRKVFRFSAEKTSSMRRLQALSTRLS